MVCERHKGERLPQGLCVGQTCAGAAAVFQASVVAPGKMGQEPDGPPLEGSRGHLPRHTERAPVAHGICRLCLRAYAVVHGIPAWLP